MRLTPSDPDVETVVGRIADGSIDLQPNFQRGEVWPISKRQKLIDSILRDWHIPPIHVVVDTDNKQLVLDGQQRLASIRDFFDNRFPVDGKAEPYDEKILALDGLYYSDLPPEWKRSLEHFTLRIYRITNYEPSEPGELFFRLNQPSSLTAAEQRNAFFGRTREQVKSLVVQMEEVGLDEKYWGFGNARMAYDDIVARACLVIENNSLRIKVTSTDLANRYRVGEPFPPRIERQLLSAFHLLSGIGRLAQRPKFNKATAQTWMVFAAMLGKSVEDRTAHDRLVVERHLSEFVESFYRQKRYSDLGIPDAEDAFLLIKSKFGEKSCEALLDAFEDRSTSRVADTTSVVIRDLVVWIHYWSHLQFKGIAFPRPPEQVFQVANLAEYGFLLHTAHDVEGLATRSEWGFLTGEN